MCHAVRHDLAELQVHSIVGQQALMKHGDPHCLEGVVDAARVLQLPSHRVGIPQQVIPRTSGIIASLNAKNYMFSLGSVTSWGSPVGYIEGMTRRTTMGDTCNGSSSRFLTATGSFSGQLQSSRRFSVAPGPQHCVARRSHTWRLKGQAVVWMTMANRAKVESPQCVTTGHAQQRLEMTPPPYSRSQLSTSTSLMFRHADLPFF
ncbi:hypothetical protein Esti_001326 [Eimeria stiedai]